MLLFILAVYNVDYWVISTDYEDYSLVYGCDLQTAEGLCQEYHVHIFGRRTNITEESDDLVKSLFEDICADENDILVTPHEDGKKQ